MMPEPFPFVVSLSNHSLTCLKILQRGAHYTEWSGTPPPTAGGSPGTGRWFGSCRTARAILPRP